MKKVWSAASLVIIALLGITSIVCIKGVFESLVARQVDAWFSGQPTIYTSQLTDEQKGGLVSELQGLVNEEGLTAISQTRENMRSGATLCTFSVLAPSSGKGSSIGTLAVLGTAVIDDALVQRVSSGDAGCYAGYGNDAFSQVSDLPGIRSGLYFRIDRLGSGGDLGDACAFFGLGDDGFQVLVGRLSSAIGVSPETLTARMSGSASVFGLAYAFCAGAFALLALVLCLLMVTRSLLELKTLGVHLMLGWSKLDVVSELIFPQALQMLALIPIGFAGASVVLDGFAMGPGFAAFALMSVLPAVAAVLAAAVLAAAPLLSARPVEAIHGRYSRRGFYALAVAVHLVCLVAIFAGCLYIDQPLSMYADLARTRSTWQAYEGWYVVRDFGLGDAQFTGNPMGLSQDMYTWYAEHEHDDGVYLANASRFEGGAIRAYAGGSMAIEPFWYLAASPSYLKLIGIDIPDDLVARAERGERVYLLPESLSADEAGEMERLLMAAHRPVDSNIVTPFMESPAYEFAPYDGERELFTWATGAGTPVTAKGFVIAVVTAANMVPFESESLVASGLDNAYVKFDGRAASHLLDDEGRSGLKGSMSVRFATVGNYIDGLQKSLGDLFALFSVVLVVLVGTVGIMVACLIDVANRVGAREVSVKYVLGFGVWGLYRREVLFVSITALASICASAALRCNAGMLVGGALLVISNLVIGVAARRRSAAVVLETVSKE